MLNQGKDQELSTSKQGAGHSHPSSTGGESTQWKYAQNHARKNMASDRMKSAIPHLQRSCTVKVW